MSSSINSGNTYDGEVTSLQDASLFADDPEKQASKISAGSELWYYQQQHTYNGVPVVPDAWNLPIEREEQLQQALELHRRPRSIVVRISPDDNKGNDTYTELLERQSKGEIIIINECKNFDPQTAAFIVWVTYDELSYALHPRFRFLRED